MSILHRYRWLGAVAVLAVALGGYGWAARQPPRHEGVARVRLAYPCPPEALCIPFRPFAQQSLSSTAVLQRAVEFSGSSITAETLAQRLKVEIAQGADQDRVIAVRVEVVDETAKGAAQLANAVPLAFQQVLTEQNQTKARRAVADLTRTQRQLQDQIDGLDDQLAADPGNRGLQASRDAAARLRNGIEQRKAVVGGVYPRLQVLAA